MTHYYEGWPATQGAVPLAGAGTRLRQFGTALLLALGLATGSAQAQQRLVPSFFQADGAARTAAVTSPLAATLTRSQALTLDEAGLRAALASAPLETRVGAAPLVLALPQPDGTTARFALREAPVMEPALAAKFPQIKTYAGIGLDDATATVRLDLTPWGFHAQVLSGTGRGFDIAPAGPTDTRYCLSYYRQDMKPAAASKAPSCRTVITPAEEQAGAARVAAWRAAGSPAARATGAQLRTYRVALACLPVYAASVGNTVAGVRAVQATCINQLNGIFEREQAVRFVLVDPNNSLIFLSGGTPPPFPYYIGDMSQQNQLNTDRLVGDANYDMGLVMTLNGGGGVLLGSVCRSGSKANGNLGFFVATETLYGALLAHEMGHQLGAPHSFNNCVISQANPNSSWEPGSGVTIMGYGGTNVCLDDEYQSYRETVFHTGSYEDIQANLASRNCVVPQPTGNTPPVIVVPASGKTLPAGTPFKLTATATDANGDPLTYSWEEIDRGPFGPITTPQATNVTPPLFRTWAPVTSGTRYFPRLAELVSNTTARGEVLPTVSRKLRFRCTARDLHVGLVGVVGGITSSDSVNLRVSAGAGPFVVTAPNAALSWMGGSTQTVSWNVANTTAAPVSCATVNLRLSLDGGLTYPTVLATGVVNSGSASVTVPNAPTATARVMVEAADNYFFDISNANFTITPGSGPVISSFTPAFGPVGTVVTLTGTGFTGATAVRFNGTVATSVTVVSATRLTATVGAGSTSGLITVTTPLGTGSSATPFLVGPPPALSSFTPTSGPTGTVVTLRGTNFLGASQVQINGNNVVDFSVISAAQLVLTLPDNASTGLLTVTTPFGTASSSSPFTVVPPTPPTQPFPVIWSLAPATGSVGTVVTLTGSDFSGATALTINRVVVTGFTVASATSMTFRVPAGATTGNVVVTTGGGASNGVPFTVTVVSATAAANATAFSVWPNPVGAKGTLHITLAGASASASYSLHNVLGQVVSTRSFSGSTAELGTAGLAAGTYLLTVQTAGRTPTVQRVVVE